MVRVFGGAGLSLVGDVLGDPFGEAEAKWLAVRAAMIENGVSRDGSSSP